LAENRSLTKGRNRWNHGCQTPRSGYFPWSVAKRDVTAVRSLYGYYKCTENTSLIRELDLNIVLWKQTALNRACFKSQQRSLLRRLYQRICIQAPVVQGIRHRVYFMFLDREKSLWPWVRILKSGFDKGCFFSFHCFSTYVFIVYL